MVKRDPHERLQAMVEYILSEKAHPSIVKEMPGDIADETMGCGDVRYIRQLIRSGNLDAMTVAACATHLVGPLASQLVQDLLLLRVIPDCHPIHPYAEDVIQQYCDERE